MKTEKEIQKRIRKRQKEYVKWKEEIGQALKKDNMVRIIECEDNMYSISMLIKELDWVME